MALFILIVQEIYLRAADCGSSPGVILNTCSGRITQIEIQQCRTFSYGLQTHRNLI